MKMHNDPIQILYKEITAHNPTNWSLVRVTCEVSAQYEGIWDCLRGESPMVTEFQEYRLGGDMFREVKQVGERERYKEVGEMFDTHDYLTLVGR